MRGKMPTEASDLTIRYRIKQIDVSDLTVLYSIEQTDTSSLTTWVASSQIRYVDLTIYGVNSQILCLAAHFPPPYPSIPTPKNRIFAP